MRPQRKADPKPLLNVSAASSLHSGFFCVVSLGLNYIFMGQADEEGRGTIAPHHFIMAFKAKNQRAVNMLKNKRCWAFTEDLWSLIHTWVCDVFIFALHVPTSFIALFWGGWGLLKHVAHTWLGSLGSYFSSYCCDEHQNDSKSKSNKTGQEYWNVKSKIMVFWMARFTRYL